MVADSSTGAGGSIDVALFPSSDAEHETIIAQQLSARALGETNSLRQRLAGGAPRRALSCRVIGGSFILVTFSLALAVGVAALRGGTCPGALEQVWMCASFHVGCARNRCAACSSSRPLFFLRARPSEYLREDLKAERETRRGRHRNTSPYSDPVDGSHWLKHTQLNASYFVLAFAHGVGFPCGRWLSCWV